MKSLNKSSTEVFSNYYLELCKKIHNQKVLSVYSSFNVRNPVNRITDILNYSVYKEFYTKKE